MNEQLDDIEMMDVAQAIKDSLETFLQENGKMLNQKCKYSPTF